MVRAERVRGEAETPGPVSPQCGDGPSALGIVRAERVRGEAEASTRHQSVGMELAFAVTLLTMMAPTVMARPASTKARITVVRLTSPRSSSRASWNLFQ